MIHLYNPQQGQYTKNWIKGEKQIEKMKGINKWSSPRPISTAKLNMLPCLHTQPINLVVYKGPYQLALWDI